MPDPAPGPIAPDIKWPLMCIFQIGLIGDYKPEMIVDEAQ